MTPGPIRIGFVSTRLAGTDGVSLETEKWAHILTRMGQECFYFAGECDRPADRSHVVPEAHFKHPTIESLNRDLFNDYTRSNETSGKVQKLRYYLKEQLYRFLNRFELNLLIIENALSLPMNVPLALALTELIAETSIPTIAHHHDFAWERRRFAVHAAADYLGAAFPPDLPSIHHVVINSYAARQLALRKGVTSTLIPNVMDFDSPPPEPDAIARTFRQAIGLDPEEHMLLQPTRIVPRKRIELAIELTRRLDSQCALVISHASGDEGTAYQSYLAEYAALMGVRVIFAGDLVDHERVVTHEGVEVYSLADAYSQADLVTYPSTVEGFGNAFLETIYYRRPIVISTYEIFKTDIQPKGFRVIGFDEFITDETVRQAQEILDNPELAAEMCDQNYRIGRRYYSFTALEAQLMALLNRCVGA